MHSQQLRSARDLVVPYPRPRQASLLRHVSCACLLCTCAKEASDTDCKVVQMPTYKLIYFKARGTGELSRFIFAQAGVEYEDVRVDEGDWPALKPTMPFGVIPVLEVDGKQLGSSMTIARYLAETFGLAGDNALENAEIASIIDTIGDVNRELYKYWFGPEAKSEEYQKKLREEILPPKLKLFEKRSSTNESGWQFGGKLTWADFGIYLMLDLVFKIVGDDILKDYPGLTKLRASVEALPKIAEWFKKRPVTEH